MLPTPSKSERHFAMAAATLPSPALLRQLLRYEADTGCLYWRLRPREMFVSLRGFKVWNSRYVGQRAFTYVGNHGYHVGAIYDRTLLAHRVIWAMEHDEWPAHQIDHINGIRTDNRVVNLRAVTDAENKKNVKLRSDNASGLPGVYFNAECSKRPWAVSIGNSSLGVFATFEEAAAVRQAAEQEQGYHLNHGRKA